MANRRIEDYNKKLAIVELYIAVQSEGSRAGYPTLVVRTTGCTHRCFFGEGGWCDSWYTSIHPEKGSITMQDVEAMIIKNPQLSDMMITGGSPTMHPAILNELTYLCDKYNLFSTMETEGSHYVETDVPINLLSISPKFSNSIPKLGEKTPQGSIVTEKFIKIHNKRRCNKEAINKMIEFHDNFHIKPVWNGIEDEILDEILEFIKDYPEEKIWFMPAGDTSAALKESYPRLFDWVAANGYRLTWRPHIIAFEDKRGV